MTCACRGEPTADENDRQASSCIQINSNVREEPPLRRLLPWRQTWEQKISVRPNLVIGRARVARSRLDGSLGRISQEEK